jgi:hypothetical protein
MTHRSIDATKLNLLPRLTALQRPLFGSNAPAAAITLELQLNLLPRLTALQRPLSPPGGPKSMTHRFLGLSAGGSR